jgi:lipopolysaccharide transport system ATP-binding protein
MKPAIVVEHLGKRFRAWRQVRSHNTLRDAIAGAASGLLRPRRLRANRDGGDYLWALRDIDFRIMPGETLGIIGPNGAGKSTLLKVLAQITEPTEGQGQVRGRVGSLLEVGTGFHSELTGRENIYLNGAILGMRRAEIVRKFDAIVDFAEVEQFVDTPMKHFSSGMYLRLAFAVAAHLDPDILIVDEVLAVGDERFQRKCISKMEEVSRHSGRTILFVSHNLAAVQGLCERCLLLDGGRLRQDGATRDVIGDYLGSLADSTTVSGQSVDVALAPRRGTGLARFTTVEYASDEAAIAFAPYTDGPMTFRLRIVADRTTQVSILSVSIRDLAGTVLLDADSFAHDRQIKLHEGENLVNVKIRALHLKPGMYAVGLRLEDERGVMLDQLGSAFGIQVLAGPGAETTRNLIGGVVSCDFDIGVEAIPPRA